MNHQGRCPLAATRWAWIGLGALLVILNVAGCSPSSRMGLIATTSTGDGFVDPASSEPYIPFGTNYYDPNTGWPPQVWRQLDLERTAQHFEVLRLLGANCARIFLTAETFQPEADTVDEQALEKLDAVIEIARRADIRLIVTGPGPLEGEPPYWQPDRFTAEKAIAALEYFWTVAGQRYRDEPAIFAWDLANEPQMPWSAPGWAPRWNAWLESKYTDRDGLKAAWGEVLNNDEAWGDIEIPDDVAERDNPRLRDWQLFREHLADQWVQRQATALREADPTHLITLGYIQSSYPVLRPGDPSLYSAFNPRRQAQWLDFVSVHFYPLLGRPFGSRDYWLANLAYLQTLLAYCQVGKPVVLGEYGWYGGGAPDGRPYLDEDQQDRWIAAEVEASRRLARGWLSWPFADTPEATDMAVYGGLVRRNMESKMWGVHFQTFASKLSVLPQPMPKLPVLDVSASLTAPVEDLLPMHEAHAAAVQEAIKTLDPVPRIPLRLQLFEEEVGAN